MNGITLWINSFVDTGNGFTLLIRNENNKGRCWALDWFYRHTNDRWFLYFIFHFNYEWSRELHYIHKAADGLEPWNFRLERRDCDELTTARCLDRWCHSSMFESSAAQTCYIVLVHAEIVVICINFFQNNVLQTWTEYGCNKNQYSWCCVSCEISNIFERVSHFGGHSRHSDSNDEPFL